MPSRRRPPPKKLSQQVIVITGASSGIGLVTARRAAACGARVVLAARNLRDLERAAGEIRAAGGQAIAVRCEVSDAGQVAGLAASAIEAFGGIDTWINNAAVSMYGRIADVPLEDARRQIEVNFWGYVHGSIAAVRHMRDRGGAIVQVTSALADRAIPLQGYYCAAKHAVKAFTDTLRMELEAEGIPIAVSQVKPGSTDTPFFEKARNHFATEPQAVPPVYAPEIVASVILDVCERPRRDVVVSGMGKLLSVSNQISPRLTDLYLERRGMESAQLSDIPSSPQRRDNLWAPLEDDGGERGHIRASRTKETSAYNQLEKHRRAITAAIVSGIASIALGSIAARALGSRAERRLSRTAPSPREAYVGAVRAFEREIEHAEEAIESEPSASRALRT